MMQAQPLQPDRPSGPDVEAELDRHADRYADIVCANCITANRPFNHFCDRCGLPLTAYATIAPLEQVYTLGHGYRQATDGPSRPILLLGLWLIFGLPLPLMLYSVWHQLVGFLFGGATPIRGTASLPTAAQASEITSLPLGSQGGAVPPAVEWAGFLLLLLMTVIHCLILYKATRQAWHRRSVATGGGDSS